MVSSREVEGSIHYEQSSHLGFRAASAPRVELAAVR